MEYTLDEVRANNNWTFYQMYRKFKLYDLKPKKIRGCYVLSDKDIEILKGDPVYASKVDIGKMIGVSSRSVVTSNSWIEFGSKRYYNVEDAKRLTIVSDEKRITAKSMMKMFNKPYYRILAAIPENKRTKKGIYDQYALSYVAKHFQKYGTVREIAKECSMSENEVFDLIKIKKIKSAYVVKNINIYEKDEVIKAIEKMSFVLPKGYNEKMLEEFRREDDSNKILKIGMKYLRLEFPGYQDTLKLFTDYCNYYRQTCKVQDEECKRNKAINLIKALRTVLVRINKEITEYTDDEIIELGSQLNRNNADQLKKVISYLINHSKQKHVCMCSYIQRTKKVSDESYTQEEWKTIIDSLLNIDRHIDKALENQLYAQIWLFQISHLFLAWRASDFSKLPVPFMDFKEIITFEESELVIQDIKEKMIARNANKNNEPLSFVHPPAQVQVPFVVAMLVCKRHNNKMLIPSDIARNYKRYQLTNPVVFKSLKANHTLETMHYITALQLPGFAPVAYQYARVARSHKPNVNQVTDTTSTYIDLIPNQYGAFTDELVVSLCKRGSFGWLYEDLLNILTYGNAKALPFYEKTNAIIELKNSFTPIEAECLADYLLDSIDYKNQIINEWKENLDSLKKIVANGLLNETGKTPGVICTSLDGCIHAVADSCTRCPFAIMPMHMASEIGSALNKSIKELNTEKANTKGNANYNAKLERDIAYLLDLASSFKKQFGNNKYINGLLTIERSVCENNRIGYKRTEI